MKPVEKRIAEDFELVRMTISNLMRSLENTKEYMEDIILCRTSTSDLKKELMQHEKTPELLQDEVQASIKIKQELQRRSK